MWKRHAAFWSVLVFAGLANFCVTGLAPAFRPLGMQFHLTEFQLTWLISITSLGMILGCFTVAPFASKFGKRPVFLVSASVFFACNIWAASSKSYISLLLARLFAIWSGAFCNTPSVLRYVLHGTHADIDPSRLFGTSEHGHH